jgi:hypothetical protein
MARSLRDVQDIIGMTSISELVFPVAIEPNRSRPSSLLTIVWLAANERLRPSHSQSR